MSISNADSKPTRIWIGSKTLFCSAWILVCIFLLTPTNLFSQSTKSKPKTVHNTDKGFWDKAGSHQLNLEKDIELGKEEGKEQEIFGRVYDIATDAQNHICILDNGYSRVQKYDSSGIYLQTIGRDGEGPGEFSFPMALAIDNTQRLYVGCRGRVVIFDEKGDYLTEFKTGLGGGFVRSLKTDRSGNIFISALEILDQKAIHKFSPEGEKLLSFCDSYATGDEVDLRVEAAYGGGAIDIDDDGIIYYTQLTPYEIRKFNTSGILLSSIFRANDFITLPQAELVDGGMRISAPTASYSIVVLRDGKFINVIKKPISLDEPTETIIDLFDEEGRLLTTRVIKRNINIKCTDAEGRLYAADYDEYPSVVRYHVSFPKSQARVSRD